MLLKDSSYQGYWWLAGSNQRVPGVFDYSVSEGLHLRLNGSFDSEVFRSFGGSDVVRDVVHGQTDSGKPVRRVPRNTHAPLTLPGMLSTAGHWDQSSVAMF